MIDDARAYAELMTILQEQLPDLHDQIADEVGRGRELRGRDIESRQRQGIDRVLADQKLGRLAESDVSVFPFTDQERLDLLLAALRTAAETRDHSLEAVNELLSEAPGSPGHIAFQRPESDEAVLLELPDLRVESTTAKDVVRRLEEAQSYVEADRSDREDR